MEKGCVHVYTGNGKGKTTAMFGLALRAYGAGLKIYIGQFIKNGEYSEVKAIRKYLPNIDFEQYGYGTGFIFDGDVTDNDINFAKNGLHRAGEAISSGKYDVVMLDEINAAIHYGLIGVKEVVDLIARKPYGVELILTGRYAADEIMDASDLISEINEVKHYYAKGITARDGIEK